MQIDHGSRKLVKRATGLLGCLALALAAVVVPSSSAQAGPPQRNDSDVISNMFQWTWNSIARECTQVLGPAGYGYVQVSPPQEHIRGNQWWTSYQPVSYKIESKLGTRAEFKSMIDTCNDAGVGVIADTVINHMTGQTGGTGWAGTPFSTESYPGPEGGYSAQDFNTCKRNIANYGDRYEVQNCRLVGLQDLATAKTYVREEIARYLDDLASLGVDGYRVDAAKHIPAADLEAIKAATTTAKNLYWIHEVIGAPGEPIQPSEYLGSGDSHEFGYGRALKSAFDGNIAELQNINNRGFLPSNRAGVFVDNHDTERNGETMTYKWGAKYKLGNIFMLSYPYGSPSTYSGYTFTNYDAGAPQASNGKVNDANCDNAEWTCAHRWPEIKNMVGFHNTVTGTSLQNWQSPATNVIAYSRGNKGFVALNNTNATVSREFSASLPNGTYCNVVASDTCSQTFTVSGGKASVSIPAFGGVALHVGALAEGPGPGPDPSDKMTVFYSTDKNWNTYNVHYRIGSGAWTTAPGEKMTPACTGWVKSTVASNGQNVTAVFNNGSGTWDNNSSRDYALTGAVAAVKDGNVTAADPCATNSNNSMTVFYSTAANWNTYNIHYRVGSGAWTSSPGERMAPACTGWVSRTLTSNGNSVTAVFNNGSGVWDNNSSRDYTLTGSAVRVSGGSVSSGNPCS
ncbi:carbohydrate binding domain-containing protein [Jonesia quinghaiensis]|uniref:carbohydrate binding domain-containing protein n=1 Tax=Jonesia quinghaiensis TaxID=262806 RepID=UPI000416917A|nr:carbohydrate binding domain-containing protein [Jonesia quinghaiensis]